MDNRYIESILALLDIADKYSSETIGIFNLRDSATLFEISERTKKIINELSNIGKNNTSRIRELVLMGDGGLNSDSKKTSNELSLSECVDYIINVIEKIKMYGRLFTTKMSYDVFMKISSIKQYLSEISKLTDKSPSTI